MMYEFDKCLTCSRRSSYYSSSNSNICWRWSRGIIMRFCHLDAQLLDGIISNVNTRETATTR